MWAKGLAQSKKIVMSTLRNVLFRVFLLAIFLGAYVYLTYGKEDAFPVPIARHLAWNDFITQIRFLPKDSPEAALEKELPVIQRFPRDHETESRSWLGCARSARFVRACIKQTRISERSETNCPTKNRKPSLGGDTREISNAPALQ